MKKKKTKPVKKKNKPKYMSCLIDKKGKWKIILTENEPNYFFVEAASVKLDGTTAPKLIRFHRLYPDRIFFVESDTDE